jgi:hypothetical protein
MALPKFQFWSPIGGRKPYSFHPESPRKDDYTVGGVVNGQYCSLGKNRFGTRICAASLHRKTRRAAPEGDCSRKISISLKTAPVGEKKSQ